MEQSVNKCRYINFLCIYNYYTSVVGKIQIPSLIIRVAHAAILFNLAEQTL